MKFVFLALIALTFQAQAGEVQCRNLSVNQLSVVARMTPDEFDRAVKTCRRQADSLKLAKAEYNAAVTNLVIAEMIYIRNHPAGEDRADSP